VKRKPVTETTDTARVIINGESRRVATGVTLSEMIAGLGLDPAKVAVEHNRAIVPRSTLGTVRVADGDQFEIVHFVGGG
jgi:thiamine biosynthesis protein ThiS